MLLTGSTIALEEIPLIVEVSIENANMADFSITLSNGERHLGYGG